MQEVVGIASDLAHHHLTASQGAGSRAAGGSMAWQPVGRGAPLSGRWQLTGQMTAMVYGFVTKAVAQTSNYDTD